MKKCTTLISLVSVVAACGAHAQSNVTLFGIVDNGIVYQSNSTPPGATAPGHSVVKMMNGAWAGSRIGLKGSEDLGGGTQAIFQLELGANTANGAATFPSGIFSRQAWVGVTDPTFGTLTAGRQYTAYYTVLSPYSPSTWLTGYFGSHPGDVDSLNTGYRANNSLVYISPRFYGLVFGASYSFGGTPGSLNAGSAWSAGLQYINGPFGIAAAFQRINNSAYGGGQWGENSAVSNGGAQPSTSAINNGYLDAQAQQRFAVTTGYRFTQAWEVSASYSNVQFIPGAKSGFHNTATFNSAGAALHFKPAPQWDFGAGYAYTRATQSNGIEKAARYHQFTLSQYYSLSKRTGLYAAEAFQRASGQTMGGGPLTAGQIVAATASIGDGFNGAPSSTRSQIAVGAGLVHRF